MNLKTQFTRFTLAAGALLLAGGAFAQQNTVHGPREQGSQTMSAATTQTLHKTVQVDGVEIFYREAGPKDAPTVLLLHGFPTSSHMFRNLIPQLAERYHVLAPDYPGFGASEMPDPTEFEYSFDNFAQIIRGFLETQDVERYSIYLMDYGAPVGFRVAASQPERVDALLIQNGNAYDEGLREFWNPIKAYWKEKTPENRQVLKDALLTIEATKWQYTHGVHQPEEISPDSWFHDQYLLDRPGSKEIQLDLFYSYGTNPPLYPEWQEYFRNSQPPTLITWGKNDYIFPAEGATPYLRDLPNAELHLLDAGHFALEDQGVVIGDLILDFLDRNVVSTTAVAIGALAE